MESINLNSRKGRNNLFRLVIMGLLPAIFIIGLILEALGVNKYITLAAMVSGLGMFSIRVIMSKIQGD